MLLCLIKIPVRTSFNSRGLGLLRFISRLLLFEALLVKLRLQAWVLILPVANCPGYRNNALDSTILNESATFFNPLQFSIIIRLVVV